MTTREQYKEQYRAARVFFSKTAPDDQKAKALQFRFTGNLRIRDAADESLRRRDTPCFAMQADRRGI